MGLRKILWAGNVSGVLALISEYDGLNGVLMFHVEQTNTPPRAACYRLRWPQSAHPALREWGGVRTATRFPLVFSLADPAVDVEAEWRWEGEGKWRKCKPRRFGKGSGLFRIDFLKDRPAAADRDLDAMAVVGDFPALFRITLPLHGDGWQAGESIELPGESVEHGPGQHFEPGGFIAASPAMRITGLSSQATLLPCKKAAAGLSKSPPRGYIIRAGRLPEGELQAFLAQKEVTGG